MNNQKLATTSKDADFLHALYAENFPNYINCVNDQVTLPIMLGLLSNPATPETAIRGIISRWRLRKDVPIGMAYFLNPNVTASMIKELLVVSSVKRDDLWVADRIVLARMLQSPNVPYDMVVDMMLLFYSPGMLAVGRWQNHESGIAPYIVGLKSRLKETAKADGLNPEGFPMEWLVETYTGKGTLGFQYITDYQDLLEQHASYV